MMQSVSNILNKSFGSNKSSPEKTDSKLPPKKATNKVQPKKPCKLCKGAGCCTLCDRGDDWENMVYCSNKTTSTHLVHHSCDNLTPEVVRVIKDYYCPECRLDNFEIVFYKKTSSAKQEEIKNLL